MKFKNKAFKLILAIISSFSILIELDKSTFIKIDPRNTINLTFLILGIFLFLLYKSYQSQKEYLGFKILSVILSLFMIFGYSYDKLDSWYFVFGNYVFILISIFKLISFYYLFKVVMHKLYDLINNLKVKDFKNKVVDKFYKRPVLYSVIIIFLCWLPYIISFYPIILSPDPTNEIKSFFGISTRYIDGVKLVDEKVLMTNDNPIAHTFLLGGSVKIGHTLGNDNFGLFIYSAIQIVILLWAFSYSIKYLIKLKVPNVFIFLSLGIYSLVPLFPFYAMNAVKDVIFSALMLVYIIKLFDLVRYNNFKRNDYLKLIILSVFICLSRNNGIIHIILSLPFTLIFLKNSRKPILLSIASILVIYMLFMNVGLSLLHITPGNKREVFSVPFQQTARYVKYYGHDLSTEEREIIDKVLRIDTLAKRYDPVKSDKVKNSFNALSTSKDFNNYLKLWFKLLFRHPNVYIEATMNNIYGFFYPNTTKWYLYHEEYKDKLNETGIFNYHYNSLNFSRKILSEYGIAFPHIPIIGMFANIGFMVWIYLYLLVLLIKQKLSKYLVVLAPALSLILVCVAGPVNTYFRYTLPYVFAFPVTIAMLYSVYKSKNS